MADEKEFERIVSAAGIKGLSRKDPYQKICGLLGIAFNTKDSIASMRNSIIASNVVNPTRDFAEVLTHMHADAQKTRASKKVTVHAPTTNCVDTPTTDYRRPELNEVVLTVSTSNTPERIAAKERIIKIINDAHNILYTAENIEGEAALSDIMNLIFIKCLEPLISVEPAPGKIDLLNPKHYELIYPDPEKLGIILGYFVDLKTLANEEMRVLRSGSIDIPDAISEIGIILSTHPVTGRIFTLNRFAINANKPNTIKKLLDDVIRKINVAELSENYDVVGDIYEHFINKYVKKGSKLGQYFTPRNLMSIILTYKHSEIAKAIEDEKEEFTVIDPCMGTGGWLVSAFSQFAREYASKLHLCGIEVKPTTFQYGIMNLILAIKHMPGDIKCESSLTCVNDTKYNLLVTNPPFQTGKKFADIVANFESDEVTRAAGLTIDDVYKLKTNNPPLQFLELDIFKLKQNGHGIIIIPDGDVMHGKSFADARRHIMSIVSVTDIIQVPGGVFTHTGIKTCAIVFKKSGATQSINFLQANDDCSTLTMRAIVAIEDINKQSRTSWKVEDYLMRVEQEYRGDITIKSLNSLCEFVAKSKHLASHGLSTGKFPFFTSSQVVKSYVDEPDHKKESIILGTGGNPSVRYSSAFSCSADNLILTSQENADASIRYIYWYLFNNIQILADGFEGATIKHISKEYVKEILIPCPPRDTQNQIVEYLDFIETCSATSARKIDELMKLNDFIIITRAIQTQLPKVRLGDLCTANAGTYITQEMKVSGEYPVYGGGDVSFYINAFNREDELVVAKDGVSDQCVRYISGKFFLNHHGWTFTYNQNLRKKYMYLYLRAIQPQVVAIANGSAQKGINKESFYDLEIRLPTLDIQDAIIHACDLNHQLISALEREIAANKKAAADYLRDVLA